MQWDGLKNISTHRESKKLTETEEEILYIIILESFYNMCPVVAQSLAELNLHNQKKKSH